MITSLYISRRGSHVHVTVRWKGAAAGTLVVDASDEGELVRTLTGDDVADRPHITLEVSP